jgi:hypothetical protein
MKRSKFTEEQIVFALKEHPQGIGEFANEAQDTQASGFTSSEASQSSSESAKPMLEHGLCSR